MLLSKFSFLLKFRVISSKQRVIRHLLDITAALGKPKLKGSNIYYKKLSNYPNFSK